MIESRFGNASERGGASAELAAAAARSMGTTAVKGQDADEGVRSAVAEHEHGDTSVDELIDLADPGKTEEPVAAQPDVERIVLVADGVARTYDVTPAQKTRIMSNHGHSWRQDLQQISNDDLALTSSSRRTSYNSVEDRPAGERYSA